MVPKSVGYSLIEVNYSSQQTLPSNFETDDFNSCCPFAIIGSIVINRSCFDDPFIFEWSYYFVCQTQEQYSILKRSRSSGMKTWQSRPNHQKQYSICFECSKIAQSFYQLIRRDASGVLAKYSIRRHYQIFPSFTTYDYQLGLNRIYLKYFTS